MMLSHLSISLNPCSNERYSRSEINRNVGDDGVCLNPCSNGRYSRSLLCACL